MWGLSWWEIAIGAVGWTIMLTHYFGPKCRRCGKRIFPTLKKYCILCEDQNFRSKMADRFVDEVIKPDVYRARLRKLKGRTNGEDNNH